MRVAGTLGSLVYRAGQMFCRLTHLCKTSCSVILCDRQEWRIIPRRLVMAVVCCLRGASAVPEEAPVVENPRADGIRAIEELLVRHQSINVPV